MTRHLTTTLIVLGGLLLSTVGLIASSPATQPAIPWFVFLIGTVLTCLAAFVFHRHDLSASRQLNQRLEEEIARRTTSQRYLQAMLDFREQERDLIAHEIHDGFVQEVIGAQMYVESLQRMVEDKDDAIRDRVSQISDLLTDAIDEARRTIDFLKPRVVDEVGLVAALHSAVADDQKKYDFKANLHCTTDFPRLPLLAERMLFRMIREAISNVRRHAEVDTAEIWLGCDEDRIIAEVIDQGIGFDIDSVPVKCFGLDGMKERGRFLNGTVTVVSNSRGTKVQIEVPIDLDADVVQPPINDSTMMQLDANGQIAPSLDLSGRSNPPS